MQNKIVSLICLIVYIAHSSAQRTPSISYISQEQIKDIGGKIIIILDYLKTVKMIIIFMFTIFPGTVELDCSVQFAREYTVVWIKGGRNPSESVFLSTGSSLVIKDSRFSLRYDGSSSTYTLQIKDIQEVCTN